MTWSSADSVWTYAVAAADVAIALTVSLHIVLKKRDDRAAVTWLAIVWLAPFAGTVLYWLFGVNRIRRRALKLRGPRRDREAEGQPGDESFAGAGAADPFLRNQMRIARRFPDALGFSAGNSVRILRSGDAAYPEMLKAVENASASIALGTYIFNSDRLGKRFAAALGAAVRRGVEVRVLVDGIGALYSLPTSIGMLRRHGVRTARFLTSILPWRMPYLNLRNHRKVMIVDGRIGFTGGINIKFGHMLSEHPPHPTPDLHFRIDGPAVGDLMAAFASDWTFTTGESLAGAAWSAKLAPSGSTFIRCIASGPNEELGSLRVTLLSALTQIHQRLRIATPYFLPDEEITNLLVITSLRGVMIDIVLPARSNLFFIKWAETASFRRLIAAGCRIWLEAPPFDHAKVAVADGRWVLFGSSNWDSRSLRLNFELDCECFDASLARDVEAIIDGKIARSNAVSIESLEARRFSRRLVEGIARLFRPFL